MARPIVDFPQNTGSITALTLQNSTLTHYDGLPREPQTVSEIIGRYSGGA